MVWSFYSPGSYVGLVMAGIREFGGTLGYPVPTHIGLFHAKETAAFVVSLNC